MSPDRRMPVEGTTAGREAVRRLARSEPRLGGRRAWAMLALGVSAQTATAFFLTAPAFLVPLLHVDRHLGLTQAGLLASAPSFGMVLTLVAWGALADRFGERWVIASGLALTALAAGGAALVNGYVALGVLLVGGGMAAGSSNAASGRVVVGWFPRERRGLAMGIRQVAQPLGTTLAALVVPGEAARAGIRGALGVPAVLLAALAALCAAAVADPPRPARPTSGDRTPANPYRGSRFLVRVHAVSMLLVVPQFTLSIFGLLWLTSDRHWSRISAGALVGAAQLVGAFGRIAVGVLSDRVGSRVGPLRWVAASAVLVMVVLAALDASRAGPTALAFVVATSVTVADNGLAFTSVAEHAGPFWSGRALGLQNTGQYLVATGVGPVVGALVAAAGYPLTFLAVASCPLVALVLVPSRHSERRRR